MICSRNILTVQLPNPHSTGGAAEPSASTRPIISCPKLELFSLGGSAGNILYSGTSFGRSGEVLSRGKDHFHLGRRFSEGFDSAEAPESSPVLIDQPGVLSTNKVKNTGKKPCAGLRSRPRLLGHVFTRLGFPGVITLSIDSSMPTLPGCRADF